MDGVYDVVVIGGGIAGLAAAHAARDLGRVLILEGSPQLGGKLRVTDFAGAPVDEGAEQVLVRSPEAVDLMRAVGLGDDIVHPVTSAARIWTRGALRPLPTGTVLGVPADPLAVARSGVLSPAGLARAAADIALPRTHVDGDVAIGRYVAARAGREVVDRLVDPLLGGVYAGRAEALSLAATVPVLAEQTARHRTLLGAARAARANTGATGGPVFGGLVGGLGRLPAAVADELTAAGVEIRTTTTVRTIEQTGDGGFRLATGPVPAPQTIDARSVVVAVPSAPAARLLSHVAAASAAEIKGIDYASVVTVTLAYADALNASGSGFLVPAVDGRVIKAATFLSLKWAHLRGPLSIVRVSVGRYGDEHDIQRDDDDLVAAVHGDLAAAIGVTALPVLSRVSRWGGGLPQYAPGHLDRVRRARSGLPVGVAVCGAAYDGVGVPACIRSGQAAAALLRQWANERADRSEAEGA
jgi:oxygen-dependent protoporphyrinogen oxidase